MKTRIFTGILALGLPFCSYSCEKKLMAGEHGNITVEVIPGGSWLHDFPLFWGIKIKNRPQIAIWVEDMNGNYLSTLFVTQRTATQSWRGKGDIARPEALPVWSHARNDNSIDGVSGATSKSGFDIKTRPIGNERQFVVKIEINHSTDWNDNYPENAIPGRSGYSASSGQPAVVYAAVIDLDSPKATYTAVLIGHSSPDGANGEIYPDISSLSSALNIVKEIVVSKTATSVDK